MTGMAGSARMPSTMTVDGVEALRRSQRASRRWKLTAVGVVVALLFALDVVYGRELYDPADVVRVIAGERIAGMRFTIMQLRLPRAIGALVCGAAFGMAGAAFQHLLRNVLASPDIIGITAGANTAAVWGITTMGLSGIALSALAMGGGLLTAVTVMALTRSPRSLQIIASDRVILMGIGVSAALNALTSWLLVRADQWDIQAASRWLAGSLSGIAWGDLPVSAVCLAAGTAVMLAARRPLNVMRLDADSARMIGVPSRFVSASVMAIAVLLLSAATAVTGPIAFIAFISGPMALRAFDSSQPAITHAGLVGAGLVLLADIVAQHLPMGQLPVGVVTSVVGAPALALVLVVMSRRL